MTHGSGQQKTIKNGEIGKRIYQKTESIAATKAAASISSTTGVTISLATSTILHSRSTTRRPRVSSRRDERRRGTRSRAGHTNDIGKDWLMFSVSVGRGSYKSELELMSVRDKDEREALWD